MTTSTIHKFEQAGLGRAPFKCLGISKEVYQAIPGDPNCPIQPGSSCDYCSTAIMFVCHIQDADGKRFKVGTDCVRKTGDAGLVRYVDAQTRKKNKEAKARLDAKKMDELKALLSDQKVRARLSTLPHFRNHLAAQGKMMLEYCDWMLQNAGATGRNATLKLVKHLMAKETT